MTTSCLTCAYWEIGGWDAPEGWGDCTLAGSEDGKAHHPNGPLVAMGAEGFSAHLLTRQTFLCMAHQDRQ